MDTNKIKEISKLLKRQTKRVIKSRAECIPGSEIKNCSLIKNIVWRIKSGVGAKPDDYIVFDYKDKRYLLESRFPDPHSDVQEHSLQEVGMNKIRVEFNSAVFVPAGYRESTVIALAERISEKRCKILGIESIDGHKSGFPSLTGARRQVFNFNIEARKLRGKIKNISSLKILGEAE